MPSMRHANNYKMLAQGFVKGSNMRKVLTLGFYGEGSTDYAFLQPVIQRTVEQILAEHGRGETDIFVYLIQLAKEDKEDRAMSILHAARNAYGYDILIIHSNADSPTANKAMHERFEPGQQRVKQTKESVCRHLVPIIPIQAIEAWLLADYELPYILIELINANFA